jgi:hypothetical protein
MEGHHIASGDPVPHNLDGEMTLQHIVRNDAMRHPAGCFRRTIVIGISLFTMTDP